MIETRLTPPGQQTQLDQLWGMPTVISHLVPAYAVVMAENVEDVPALIDRSNSEQDDRYWSSQVMRAPFTWQGYLNWWIARRWVMPRDIRRS